MRARHQGNGHARNEYHERPISRMSNLVVEVDGGVSHDELKRRFLDEIRRQKLPFGIMILDAEGGETATEAYDFQAFMGNVGRWPCRSGPTAARTSCAASTSSARRSRRCAT